MLVRTAVWHQLSEVALVLARPIGTEVPMRLTGLISAADAPGLHF